MSYTFSLRRLLAGVTALCVVAGLAVNFPEPSLAFGLCLASFVPALILCWLLSLLSSRPGETMIIGMIGVMVAFLLMPVRLSDPPTTSAWDELCFMFPSLVVFTGSGACLFGCLSLAFSLRSFKRIQRAD